MLIKASLSLAVLLSLSVFCIVNANQLRIYPSDFSHFTEKRIRWPVGNSLKLTCDLDGDLSKNDYNLVWYLVPHSPRKSTNISVENGRSILWLDNVQTSDSGRYICKAEGNSITLQKEIMVNAISSFSKCNPQFYQCKNSEHHCIGERYLCDGIQDCQDGSDETVQLCGNEDWCSGKLRCGDQARCMDPSHCCDPEMDPDCSRLLDCCVPYIESNRYYFRLGIEEYNNVQRQHRNSGIFIIVGCIVAFVCILLVVLILMCQFPAEKPWLRPPNFLRLRRGGRGDSRPASHRGGAAHRNNLPYPPVTMQDLDVYFDSFRNVPSSSRNDIHHLPILQPPPYSLTDPPPPYPGGVGGVVPVVSDHGLHHFPQQQHQQQQQQQQHQQQQEDVNAIEVVNEAENDALNGAENNNEDNNNGDINGNSEIVDQHNEHVVAVTHRRNELIPPLSPANNRGPRGRLPRETTTRRLAPSGSLVVLNNYRSGAGGAQYHHQVPMRSSRSYAALTSTHQSRSLMAARRDLDDDDESSSESEFY